MELFQIDKILVEEVSNVKFLMEEKVSPKKDSCTSSLGDGIQISL